MIEINMAIPEWFFLFLAGWLALEIPIQTAKTYLAWLRTKAALRALEAGED